MSEKMAYFAEFRLLGFPAEAGKKKKKEFLCSQRCLALVEELKQVESTGREVEFCCWFCTSL